jgi:hypothetical protein
MVNLAEISLAPDVVWIGVHRIRDYPDQAAAQAAFEALW